MFLLTITINAQEKRLIRNPIRNIPKWIRNEFTKQHLEDRYSVAYDLYPYYLKADFNGDGRLDVAIQVVEKKTGKSGIAIFHGKRTQSLLTQVSILGTGNTLGHAGDNFSWANIWSVAKERYISNDETDKTFPKLEADAITIGKRDSLSGLIYWSGNKYLWHQPKKHP